MGLVQKAHHSSGAQLAGHRTIERQSRYSLSEFRLAARRRPDRQQDRQGFKNLMDVGHGHECRHDRMRVVVGQPDPRAYVPLGVGEQIGKVAEGTGGPTLPPFDERADRTEGPCPGLTASWQATDAGPVRQGEHPRGRGGPAGRGKGVGAQERAVRPDDHGLVAVHDLPVPIDSPLLDGHGIEKAAAGEAAGHVDGRCFEDAEFDR